MKSYYRLILGRGSAFASEALEGGYIGANFEINEDLTPNLSDDWHAFNAHFNPIYLSNNPGKTKISAGLACGALWTICKGFNHGDIVLCPDGSGSYRVCEVSGDYQYVRGTNLPHRRAVKWLDIVIPRMAMGESLQNSTGSMGTVSTITRHAQEIETFLKLSPAPLAIIATDPDIEDPVAFAMEKHLEDFLVANWNETELAKTFSIFQDDGEMVGQQYQTDVGPIDILAISKDKKRLLVVELKRGRASDVVVGQILRYMGYIKSEIAEPDQTVEGVIIALSDDKKIRRALTVVPNVAFYRYEIRFKLVKA